MSRQEWTNIDKSEWERGSWDDEPDQVQWVDAATGLDCLIVRTPHSGHLCGYVGVSEGHPFFGKGYDTEGLDVEVHGGLTFSDFCQENAKEGHGICHIPEAGRPEKVWWLGFDCAHSWDYSGMAMSQDLRDRYGDRPSYERSYKDIRYVERECARLAEQLANVVEAVR